MKRRKEFEAPYWLKKFVRKRDGSGYYNPMFECVKYTGEFAVATDTHMMLLLPSIVPAMLQNIYNGLLSEAIYPDVCKVIPTKFEYETELLPETVEIVARVAGAMATGRSKRSDEPIMIKVSFVDGYVRLSAQYDCDKVSTEVAVTAGEIKGEFSLYLSPSKLQTVLSCADAYNFAGKPVSVKFSRPEDPLLVEVDGLRIVLTPMRNYC
jgi:hypothetical protein